MKIIKCEKLEFNNRAMTIQVLYNEKLVAAKYYIQVHGECWCECDNPSRALIIFFMLKDYLLKEYFNDKSNFETLTSFDLNKPKFNN